MFFSFTVLFYFFFFFSLICLPHKAKSSRRSFAFSVPFLYLFVSRLIPSFFSPFVSILFFFLSSLIYQAKTGQELLIFSSNGQTFTQMNKHRGVERDSNLTSTVLRPCAFPHGHEGGHSSVVIESRNSNLKALGSIPLRSRGRNSISCPSESSTLMQTCVCLTSIRVRTLTIPYPSVVKE